MALEIETGNLNGVKGTAVYPKEFFN